MRRSGETRILTGVLSIVLLMVYAAFAVHLHETSRVSAEKRIRAHANVIRHPLWNLNPRGIEDYLRNASVSSRYSKFTVLDRRGEVFSEVKEPPPLLESCLVKAGLISEVILSRPVTYEALPVGEIRAVWRQGTLYIHGYVLFTLFLILVAASLYHRLRQRKRLLEDRVRERTEALASANAFLEREICERRRAEMAMQESEARYRILFEESPISMLVKDYSAFRRYCRQLKADGVKNLKQYLTDHPDELAASCRLVRILNVNRRSLQLFACGDKHRLMTGYCDNIFKNNKEEMLDELAAVAEGNLSALETTCTTFSGEKRQISIHSSIPPGHANEWDRVFVSIYDITDRVRAENERIRLLHHLRHTSKLEAVGTLASGIAHDFNNILSAMIGFTELSLEDAPEKSMMADNLVQVLRSAERAKSLVNHILTFSRKEAEELMDTHLRIVIRDAYRLLRATIPTSIEIVCDIETDALVLADPSQIHQVLMNLGTNAAYSMGEAAGEIRIRLWEAAEMAGPDEDFWTALDIAAGGPMVCLSVRDTGGGIPDEIRDRIFDPFFSTRERGKGTGLGLSIVHGIISSHKGGLQWRSREGEGAEFRIYLPVTVENIPADIPVAEKEEDLIAGCLLWVDDEEVQVRLGIRALGRQGFEVRGFTDSRTALAVFAEAPEEVDAVVTDMTMPGLNGLELGRRLHDIRPDLPVIICTGYSERLTEEAMADAGIDVMIMKPIDLKALVKIICRHLKGRGEGGGPGSGK